MNAKRTYRVVLATVETRVVWIEAFTEGLALEQAINLFNDDPDNLEREDNGVLLGAAYPDVLEG